MTESPDGTGTFVQLLVEARDAGVNSLGEKWIREGWRPKKPARHHEHIARLLDELKPESRAALVDAVRYFTDLSFFKLLGFLEEGVRGIEFEVTMKKEGGVRFSLISSDEDRELRSRFLVAAGE